MRSDMIGIGVRRGRRARAKPMRMRLYVIGRLGSADLHERPIRIGARPCSYRASLEESRYLCVGVLPMCRSGLRFLVCAEQSQSEAHART